ncbi:MAG: protein kinase domain-containing protein [Planctomycetota bacterium]
MVADQPMPTSPSLPAAIVSELEAILFRGGSPSERDAAVAAVCAQHPEHEAAIRPWLDAVLGLGDGSFTEEPRQIGPYRLIARLGQGGFGDVHLAQQEQPVRRRVALKVLKLGMDSAQVLQRFAREQDALARMNHDAIAKIYDAGTTPTGQPFFAMELVDGAPLTVYCDREALPLRERLALFSAVCLGVHHAHQKGVVHRDLKPSNVLVAKVGERHQPKLIDFGIARALEGDAGTPTLTETGMLLGTPAYMAPEQARGDLAAIDTRTDVYALGALLFELLTGDVPFAGDPATPSSPWDLRQRILEEATPRPSARRASTTTQASAWQRQLRGELDWIVLRAMAKEPERRYASAAELAADIDRYLAQEPVSAGPPSASYRLRTFVRRHRLQVGGVSALCVFGALAVWGFATRAQAVEQHAKVERSLGKELGERRREVDLFSVKSLVERAESAWPPPAPAWPTRVDPLRAWLAEFGDPLPAAQARVVAALAELRTRAEPMTPEEQAAAAADSAHWAEAKHIEALAGRWERAAATATGQSKLELPALPKAQLHWNALQLSQLVLPRLGYMETVKGLGKELETLALARRIQELVLQGDTSLPEYLMWHRVASACISVGEVDEAREAAQRFVSMIPPNHGNAAAFLDHIEEIGATLTGAGWRQRILELRVQADRLRQEFEATARRRFRLAVDQALYDSLLRDEASLRGLIDRLLPEAKGRLAWADRVEKLTLMHPRARVSWEEAAAAIARADGIVASELYAASPLALKPQWGLVPIGMNPVTKLWEFYELRSAFDLDEELAAMDELAIPLHDEATGNIPVLDGTGVVFVLVPGGSFQMGAAPTLDSIEPNEGPVHEVTLAPFFLARHELTQAQWARLRHGDRPSAFAAGQVAPGHGRIGPTNPVESISWRSAMDVLPLMGCCLPTEAQWEFAARAGTRGFWWTGNEVEGLVGVANLYDRTAKSAGIRSSLRTELAPDDRMALHAAVDSLRANAWGFHGIHGNVAEWVQDTFVSYLGSTRPGDGLRQFAVDNGTLFRNGADARVARGGSFGCLPMDARSSSRLMVHDAKPLPLIGLRIARKIHP